MWEGGGGYRKGCESTPLWGYGGDGNKVDGIIIHCGNYTRTNISRTNWRVKIVWGGYRKGCKSTPLGGMEDLATLVNIIH